MNGARNFFAGQAAEEVVSQFYKRDGATEIARRWRGKSGEIDLIMRDSHGLIFVEVKASSSLERAANRLTARQIRRVAKAAEEFVDQMDLPDQALRIDGALVDDQGRIETLENISMM